MIILLSGYKRSGKDTVGNYLINKYGYLHGSFSRYLKDICAIEYKLPRNWFDDQSYKEMPLTMYPVKPRDILSNVMFEALKDNLTLSDTGNFYYHTPRSLLIFHAFTKCFINPDYWVEKSVETLKKGENYVFTDFRYKNELTALQRMLPDEKIYTIRINRYDSINTKDSSERDLDEFPFDFVVSNKGTLEELFNNINTIIKDFIYE